jgi:hypothetical protein
MTEPEFQSWDLLELDIAEAASNPAKALALLQEFAAAADSGQLPADQLTRYVAGCLRRWLVDDLAANKSREAFGVAGTLTTASFSRDAGIVAAIYRTRLGGSNKDDAIAQVAETVRRSVSSVRAIYENRTDELDVAALLQLTPEQRVQVKARSRGGRPRSQKHPK